jgi:hypothetical protein
MRFNDKCYWIDTFKLRITFFWVKEFVLFSRGDTEVLGLGSEIFTVKVTILSASAC